MSTMRSYSVLGVIFVSVFFMSTFVIAQENGSLNRTIGREGDKIRPPIIADDRNMIRMGDKVARIMEDKDGKRIFSGKVVALSRLNISVEDLIMDYPKEKVPVELKKLSKLTLTLYNQTFTSLT